MGLLDALNSDEGLFGLSLLAAGAPRAGGRTSLGEGLLGASQAVAQRRQQMEDRALKQQMLQAQLQEVQAQAEQRQQAMQQMQQKAQEQQRIQQLVQSALSPVAPVDANAASGVTGPRPEALAAVGQRPAVDFQRLIAMGVPAELVKSLAEAPNLGRSKVARTIEGKDAQGRPITLQVDEFGKPIGEAVQQWKAPIQADTGGAVNFIDPTTLAQLSTLKKSNTPDALLSANTAMRGQNMTDARARESLAAGRSDGAKPPAGYRWKADGTLEAIPGGPADTKPGSATSKVQDAKDVLEILDMAEPLLKKSTGSLAGAGIDMLAGGLGISTGGAQAAAELKALQGALVSKMPKMSGPQSDKDVQLYREMAGQIGDSTLPAATRQAAIRTIRILNQKYAGGEQAPAAAPKQSLEDIMKKYGN